MNGRLDYGSLKALAKEIGVPVRELIALAPQNDPFYCGTDSQHRLGEWFAELWTAYGFPYGSHLRRVHYVLVSADPPLLRAGGEPYLNTEVCWSELCNASKYARYLGLVDVDAFVDRRNPEPHIFTPEASDDDDGLITARVGGSLPGWDLEPDIDPPYVWLKHAVAPPRYHIETWIEKSTVNDVLIPVCQRLEANLVTGLGEMSVTAVKALVDRVLTAGKPTRILYISDFDPGGQSMPVAVARKLE